jgi:hypothetical protein
MSSKLRKLVSRLVQEVEEEMLPEISSNSYSNSIRILLGDIKAALAEPLRNCDVGTAEEQESRFIDFCHGHGCKSCQLFKIPGECEFHWAHMPYEKEGEEK